MAAFYLRFTIYDLRVLLEHGWALRAHGVCSDIFIADERSRLVHSRDIDIMNGNAGSLVDEGGSD